MNQKEIDYASKINLHLQPLFEEGNENHIDKSELKDEANFKDFCEGLQRVCKLIINRVKDELNDH